jgi:hypothetical protein
VVDVTAVAVVKRSGRSLLEIAGVCGLAVAQPILADFGAAPDFFVFREVDAPAIVAFGLVVALVPPLAVWLATEVAGIGRDGRRRLAVSVAVGGLVGLLVAQLLVDLPAPVTALLAGGAAVGAGLAHARRPAVRLWAAWLSPMPVLVLLIFLFQSPVSGLVRDGDVDPAELGAFGSGEPPPVVMLVFDEWPLASIVRADGSIDADLYPNLADLAGGSTWYRDTTTAANLTNFAVPALLTGNEPQDDDAADASSHPENLFTLLGGTYGLDVTERITRLCPTSLCAAGGGDGADADDEEAELGDLLSAAADAFSDRLTTGERDTPVTDVFVEPEAAVDQARADTGEQELDDLLIRRPESLNAFLQGIQRDEAPTLHFLHLLNPHTPYRHLPDGHQYEADPALRGISAEDDEDGGDRRTDAAPPALLERQRLQLEVAHVDRLIGDVLHRLRRTGLYREALVVVTSDHGIAFRPGEGVRGLGDGAIDPTIQPELLWVPLFVKAPDQTAGEISDVPAETIDVLPTIAAHLGIDLPWTVDGVDLTEPVDADRARRFRHVQGSSFATFTLDPPAEVEADLQDVLDLSVDSVLSGEGALRWWSVGPTPELVGRPPGGGTLPAAFDDLGRFLDVDLDATVVPVVVSGRVGGAVDRVAVVVNGAVAAVVDTYADDEGPGRFAALVPPDLLVDGANEVTAHRPGGG